MLMQFVDGTQVAGVFTRSLCPSAPVDWCRQHLGCGEARGVIVNAGNANAFTGKSGAEACETVVASVADALTITGQTIMAHPSTSSTRLRNKLSSGFKVSNFIVNLKSYVCS